MRSTRLVWIGILTATSALVPRTAGACIAPPLDIPELVKNSDVVAVGTVTSVADAGRASLMAHDVAGRTMMGAFAADDVLKGTLAVKEIPFRFVRTKLFDCRYSGVPSGNHRLIFLKSTNGTYEFTSGHYPSVVAVPAAPSESPDPLDRAYHVLASVLTSATATSNDKREAIFALHRGNNETKAALRLLLRDPDPSLVSNAVAALINSGDLSVLPIAERLLSQPMTGSMSEGFVNIRGAIISLTDVRTIPGLALLIRSSDVETRRMAVSALRRTRSKAAIEQLGVALDDSDMDVRFGAAVALAEITGISWTPNMREFYSNPDPYVARWKEWLRGPWKD